MRVRSRLAEASLMAARYGVCTAVDVAALNQLPLFDERGDPRMVVEVGAGSIAKHRFDPELGAFVYQRPLPIGVAYPAPWGFFPSTLAEDGDPLDALLWDDLIAPQGLVVAVKPIALATVSQLEKADGQRVRNDRVLVVPVRTLLSRELSDLARGELERFFIAAARGSGHDATVEGWADAAAGRNAIREAGERFLRAK